MKKRIRYYFCGFMFSISFLWSGPMELDDSSGFYDPGVFFEEHFEGNANHWEEASDESVFLQIENGLYSLNQKKNSGGWVSLISSGINFQSDYSIELLIDEQIGNPTGGIGFVWAADEIRNLWEFVIWNDGSWSLNKRINGSNQVILKREKSQKINRATGRNHFTIQKKGKTFTFFANGEKLGNYSATESYGDNLGFILRNRVKAKIESIKIQTSEGQASDRAVSSVGSESIHLSCDETSPEILAYTLYKEAITNYRSFNLDRKTLDYQKALFHIESAIDIYPQQAEFWYFQGVLLSELSATPLAISKAVDSLLAALNLNPDHARSRLLLATLLQKQGNFEFAIEQYRYLITSDPNLATGIVLSPLAVCYIAADQSMEGIELFKNLMIQHPESAPIRIALAVLQHSTGFMAPLARRTLNELISETIGSDVERDHAEKLLKKWKEA